MFGLGFDIIKIQKKCENKLPQKKNLSPIFNTLILKLLAAAAQRQKRMRTSFKHHQLRVMKSYFELNHNPDAKDLKQLSQKTGLSKRVLQVWFQNARAKFRRGQGGPECPASAQSPNPNGSL